MIMKRTLVLFVLLFVLPTGSRLHAQTKTFRIALQTPDSSDLVTLTKGSYTITVARSDFRDACNSSIGFEYLQERLETEHTFDLDQLIGDMKTWSNENAAGPTDLETPLVYLFANKPVGVSKGEKKLKYVFRIVETEGNCSTTTIAAEKKWNVLALTWSCLVAAGTGE